MEVDFSDLGSHLITWPDGWVTWMYLGEHVWRLIQGEQKKHQIFGKKEQEKHYPAAVYLSVERHMHGTTNSAVKEKHW